MSQPENTTTPPAAGPVDRRVRRVSVLHKSACMTAIAVLH